MSKAWLSSHAPEITWSCGNWSVKLRDDELAEITYNSQLILRSVRALIRDQDWNTPSIIVEEVTQSENQLAIRISSSGFGAMFTGKITFSVIADVAEIEMSLVSSSDYLANRIGLNLLHPPALAGTKLSVLHSNKEVEESVFPIKISPNQPVMDISGLGWKQGGLAVNLALIGDVFEMEDQRNWTDASYKTYSRPLSLPFPYPVASGETINQKLVILVMQSEINEKPKQNSTNRILLSQQGKFPSIQLGAATNPVAADSKPTSQADLLAVPILFEVDLRTKNWKAALAAVANHKAGIDLRIICQAGTQEKDFDELLDQIKSLKILRVAVFDAEQHIWLEQLSTKLSNAMQSRDMSTTQLAGARSHFTELNRNFTKVPETCSGITFSITPLFHALNTEQLVESIAMQRLVTQQAVEMAAGKEVHVGPVTLRPRFNNVATKTPEIPEVTDLSKGYGAEWFGNSDNRQQSPELAAWLVASAAAVSISGVSSITYFEQWGPRGIQSADGEPYPIREVIELLAKMSGGETLTGDSPDGLLWAVAAKKENRTIALVANLRETPATVEIQIQDQIKKIELESFSWTQINLD
jgi:D-apionolactonase